MSETPKALFDVTVLTAAMSADDDRDDAAYAALALVTRGQVRGYVCASAIDELHTFFARTQGQSLARGTLGQLCNLFEIAPVDGHVIDAAMRLGWNYLDDALAHECARAQGLDYLITANPEDFPGSALKVQHPEVFVRELHD
ncbi:type II toxin-antitoxin system VapC family toxin [Marichromatium bheemlicum]|uniref:PIN domain-containing protein n=1 Tax=Marichromatium bheemlicum TaxID=365339 RepID=A0ABX1I6D4_9GAMM|nr:PIN domain-containing protein [Marichromatium bheemlicum]NKN31960.1 PIN domain-containing protein [Marichromatium bheemlicum]